MKKIFIVSLFFVLISCSNAKVEEISETSTGQTIETTNSGDKVDTKQLEKDLANDLNEIMNLVPNE